MSKQVSMDEKEKNQVKAIESIVSKVRDRFETGLVFTDHSSNLSECVIFQFWKVQILNGKSLKLFQKNKKSEDFSEVLARDWNAPALVKKFDTNLASRSRHHSANDIFWRSADPSPLEAALFHSDDGSSDWEFIDALQQTFETEFPENELRQQFFEWLLEKTNVDGDLYQTMTSLVSVDLFTYMELVRAKSGLVKVKKEHSNLLPLLPFIPKKHWNSDNLFSTTGSSPVDLSVSLLKFLNKQPSEIVKVFSDKALLLAKESPMIEALKKINVPKEMPIHDRLVVYRSIVGMDGLIDSPWQGDVTFFTRIGNILFKFVDENKGTNVLHDGWREIRDWLSNDGFANGFPRSNSTWASLCQRSDAWHCNLLARLIDEHVIEMAAMERGEIQHPSIMDHPKPLLNFSPLEFKDLEIDGVTAKAISDSYQLMDHASLMQHCVNTYLPRCVKGHYKVVELSCGDEVATAGYSKKNDGEFELDQVRGFRNKKPSPLIQEVAVKLLPTINKVKKTRSVKTIN